ncbi:uracil-DNA glycosylase [bacterium]|nr:MAG: uracil-DNA glycosylase [bacterium]
MRDFALDQAAVQAAREAVFAKAIEADGDRLPATPAVATGDPQARERKAAALAELDQQEVSVCTKCPLHKSRNHTVFGVGNPDSELVFVGEAPGRDEDLKGEPFVGRAGQLLDKILAAIGFQRQDIYIANILKCRPPDNRDPVSDEVAQCEPYLLRQLEIIEPTVICALGRIAAQTLLKTGESLTRMRTQVHDYHGIPMVVTYHPAALLRNPNWKRPAWEDVQKLRALYDERDERD